MLIRRPLPSSRLGETVAQAKQIQSVSPWRLHTHTSAGILGWERLARATRQLHQPVLGSLQSSRIGTSWLPVDCSLGSQALERARQLFYGLPKATCQATCQATLGILAGCTPPIPTACPPWKPSAAAAFCLYGESAKQQDWSVGLTSAACGLQPWESASGTCPGLPKATSRAEIDGVVCPPGNARASARSLGAPGTCQRQLRQPLLGNCRAAGSLCGPQLACLWTAAIQPLERATTYPQPMPNIASKLAPRAPT